MSDFVVVVGQVVIAIWNILGGIQVPGAGFSLRAVIVGVVVFEVVWVFVKQILFREKVDSE